MTWLTGSAAILAGCMLWSLAPRSVQGQDAFYRYLDAKGRRVYTNIVEQVPVDQRAEARVDLSRITLNSEVANELDAELERQHEALVETPYCADLRAAADDSILAMMWHDYGPLLVCGGVLLGFFLFTPRAVRRYGAPVWAKVLMMAIPALAIAGLFSFTAIRSMRKIDDLKQAAMPCQPDTFAALSQAPNPLVAHSRLVTELQQRLDEVGRMSEIEGD